MNYCSKLNKQKIIYIFILFHIIFLISKNAISDIGRKWTIMVYLDGDNDLEKEAIDDFLEMAAIGSDMNINIIVQFDRIYGEDDRFGNWTDCKRFFIVRDKYPEKYNSKEDLGEVNMGAPETLIDFINWSVLNYPANNYALILWNHGGGWRKNKKSILSQNAIKEICWDNTNGHDPLKINELKYALNSITSKIDIIGFDACLMGMIEVAYSLRDSNISTMVASELTEPSEGWPYKNILLDLIENPNWNSTQLASAIVKQYNEEYNDQTLSAVSLSQINTLVNSINNLGHALVNNWKTNIYPIKNEAKNILDLFSDTIIYNDHGKYISGAFGLAIYFPQEKKNFDSDYYQSEFALNSSWDEFLNEYYLFMNGSWVNYVRLMTQEFNDDDSSESSNKTGHIDLYDFCDNLLNYGKACSKTYSYQSIPYNYEDITITGNDLKISWDDSTEITLPFAFSFYCQSYTSVNISAHGSIHFDNNSLMSYESTCLPATGTSKTFIAAYWDDLDPADYSNRGTVLYEICGQIPNRRLIVQYNDVPRYECQETVSFQIILYEDTFDIVFQYKDVKLDDLQYNNGAGATIGLQENPFNAVQFSCKSPVLYNEYALAFKSEIINPIKGDIDNNEQLNLSDVILALNITSGTYPPIDYYNVDINEDDKIGIFEVIFLMNYLSNY